MFLIRHDDGVSVGARCWVAEGETLQGRLFKTPNLVDSDRPSWDVAHPGHRAIGRLSFDLVNDIHPVDYPPEHRVAITRVGRVLVVQRRVVSGVDEELCGARVWSRCPGHGDRATEIL